MGSLCYSCEGGEKLTAEISGNEDIGFPKLEIKQFSLAGEVSASSRLGTLLAVPNVSHCCLILGDHPFWSFSLDSDGKG